MNGANLNNDRNTILKRNLNISQQPHTYATAQQHTPQPTFYILIPHLYARTANIIVRCDFSMISILKLNCCHVCQVQSYWSHWCYLSCCGIQTDNKQLSRGIVKCLTEETSIRVHDRICVTNRPSCGSKGRMQRINSCHFTTTQMAHDTKKQKQS